jgi:hypothetical protein
MPEAARFPEHKDLVEEHAYVMWQHAVRDETVDEDVEIVSCTVVVATDPGLAGASKADARHAKLAEAG